MSLQYLPDAHGLGQLSKKPHIHVARDKRSPYAFLKTRRHVQLAINRFLVLLDVGLPFQHHGRRFVVWADVDKCKHSTSVEHSMSLAKNTISSLPRDFVKCIPVSNSDDETDGSLCKIHFVKKAGTPPACALT